MIMMVLIYNDNDDAYYKKIGIGLHLFGWHFYKCHLILAGSHKSAKKK